MAPSEGLIFHGRPILGKSFSHERRAWDGQVNVPVNERIVIGIWTLISQFIKQRSENGRFGPWQEMDDLILVRIASHSLKQLSSVSSQRLSAWPHLPDDKSEITMEGIHNVLCQLRLGTPNAARLGPQSYRHCQCTRSYPDRSAMTARQESLGPWLNGSWGYSLEFQRCPSFN